MEEKEEKNDNQFWKNFKTAVCKREVIIALILGLVIGLVAMYFLHPTSLAKLKYGNDTIVSFNNQGLSADALYNTMKQHYSIELILEQIDRLILDSKYTLDDDMRADVSKNTDSFLAYYERNYGYSEEEAYKAFGFEGRAELEEYLKLDYMRTLYLYDYIESKLEDGAVQKYYDENKDSLVKYDSKHILVKISDTVKDEDALAMSKEIIAKLDEGKTYDEIVTEYGDKVVAEELGYYAKDGGLETAYMEGLIALEDGAYSKEPVKTSYGYHVIFRLGTQSEVKDVRNDILDTLSTDLKKQDTNFAYNALVNMRKEADVKFYDEDLGKKYEEYCAKYEVKESSTDGNTATN